MKKLMFIAAVVAAGLAQAASVNWEIAKKSFTMKDGSKPNGATVYVFDTAAEGYTAFITSLTGGELGVSNLAANLISLRTHQERGDHLALVNFLVHTVDDAFLDERQHSYLHGCEWLPWIWQDLHKHQCYVAE